MSPEGGHGPLLIFAGAGAANVLGRQVLGVRVAKMVCVQVRERGLVICGFLTGAGWELFEVGCGRLWREKA